MCDSFVNLSLGEPQGQCHAMTTQNLDSLVRCPEKSLSYSREGKYCITHSYAYRLEKDDCAICLEEINGQGEQPLACGHWFHLSCLRACEQNVCPTCRIKIAEDEILRISFSKCEKDEDHPRSYMTEIFNRLIEGYTASIIIDDDDFMITLQNIVP